MNAKLIHKPTGREIPCETRNFDYSDCSIELSYPDSGYALIPYVHDGKLSFNDRDAFFQECSLLFRYGEHDYKADINSYFTLFLGEFSKAIISNVSICDIGNTLVDALFYIHHLSLNVDFYVEQEATSNLHFLYNGQKWNLSYAITDMKFGELLDEGRSAERSTERTSACLHANHIHPAETKDIIANASEICWMLSLWRGKYVSWREMHYKTEANNKWHLAKITDHVQSSPKTLTRLAVCCLPAHFIEIISPRFSEYSGSWCYTIYWLTRALEYSDMGSIYMVLSMIYERMISAIYCGHEEKQSTKNLYFKQRAQFCRDLAEGDYSDEQIGEIIHMRNAVMHGGDNSTKLFHCFNERHADIAKIVIATILAALGYYGEFSFQQKVYRVANIYKKPQALAASKLNFDFKG